MVATARAAPTPPAPPAPPPFGPWNEVGGNGTAQVADAAAVLGNSLYLFGINVANHTHQINIYNGRTWSGWNPVPGGGTTALSDAVVNYENKLYLFAIGTGDHHHYVNIFDGTTWAGWSEVPGGGTTITADAAVVHDGRLHLFAIGINDHEHYQNIFDGTSWAGWTLVGAPDAPTTVPDAVADLGARLYLFSIGTIDHLHYANIEVGGSWTGWKPVPGGPATAVADAAAVLDNKLYLFAIGSADHAHYVDVLDGKTHAWSGWAKLAGTATTNVTDTAAAFQGNLHLLSVAVNAHHFDAILAGTPPPPLAYNQVQQKGSHNSYESKSDGPNTRRESLFDQLEYHHVRSLEIDIHAFKAASLVSEAGAILTGGATLVTVPVIGPDFDVYHEIFDAHVPTCTTLTACLRQLHAFQDLNPQHEPITVFLEYKDTFWLPGHMPTDLDHDLASALDPTTIFTPAKFLAACAKSSGTQVTTLRAAVAACGWPTLDTLRGKVIFVVMQTNDQTVGFVPDYPNAQECTFALPLHSCDATAATVFGYAANDADAAARTAFIAPNDLGLAKHAAAIFVNMNSRKQPQLEDSVCTLFTGAVCTGNASARQTLENVSVRQTTDTLADHYTHRDDGIQQLGNEETNGELFPAFDMRSPLGWPYLAREPDEHPEAMAFPDDETAVRLVASSGDLEGANDSFAFAYLSNPNVTSTWRAAVSGAGDSSNEWAKGCLMARESTAPNANYFAVCRPEGGSFANLDDTHPARVQYRDPSHPQNPAEPEFGLRPIRDAVFVFLDTSKNEKGQFCYRGRVSNALTGGTIETSPTVCYANALALQGLAVSSHSYPKAKFLFGGLGRADATGPMQPMTAAAFHAVGVGANVTFVELGNGAY